MPVACLVACFALDETQLLRAAYGTLTTSLARRKLHSKLHSARISYEIASMDHVVIVGGGITGLAAAHYVRQAGALSGRAVRVRVVEASGRFGGKVVTHRADGFVLEGGPDAFIRQKPWALELARELGLGSQLLPSNDAQGGMAFWLDGRMVPLPEGMAGFVPRDWHGLLASPLLSWRGKLRLAEEIDQPVGRDHDESVANFIRRRCGEEVLERVAEPLLSSIHVGDVERMSLRATAPRLQVLERRFGSLTRGAHLTGPSAGSEGPLFWSLRGGLGTLIDALVDRTRPENVLLNASVQRITRTTDTRTAGTSTAPYEVHLADGDRLPADAVILTTPTNATAQCVEALAPDAAAGLLALRTASVAVVSLAFRERDVRRPFGGFGFFVPRREGRTVLACTATSRKFAKRAPADHLLLRAFVGGAHGALHLDASDDALMAAVQADLVDMLGICGPSVHHHVQRWRGGYPQYDVDHERRIETIAAALPAAVTLAGSPFFGVGMPDCVRSAEVASRAVFRALESRQTAAPEACVG